MLLRPYQMSMCWFEAVVENRFDPLKIGRVQVRVLGIHTDNLQQLPEQDLHWMQVMMPVTSASNSGVGETSGLVEGSHVIGFFRDADSCQDGIIMGSTNGIPQESRNVSKGFSDHRTDLSPISVPGVPSALNFTDGVGVQIQESTRLAYPTRLDEPDLSRLASGHNTNSDSTLNNKKKSQQLHNNIPMASGGTYSQPIIEYKSKYPYNIVSTYESGNLVEFDNTPSNERIHLYHRSSSFLEMLPNGSTIYSSAKDTYTLSHGTSYTHVGGSSVITIDKGMKLLVNSKGSESLELEVGSGGNININVKSGNVNLTVNGDVKQNITGDYVVEVGGRFKVTASRIDLN